MNDLNQKFVADLKTLADDANDILQATAADANQEVSAARMRLGRSLERARARICAAEEQALATGKAAVDTTDRYVRSHPWQTIGLAGALGLIVGLIAARRR